MGPPKAPKLLLCGLFSGKLFFFYISTLSENLLLPLGSVWVIIWGQYGYLSAHGDPCSRHTPHLARAMGPPNTSKLMFVGGSMACGVCTSRLSGFPPSTGQKWKTLQKHFDIVPSHNDKLCYVKHVLAPLYVVFNLFGCWGGSQGRQGICVFHPIWVLGGGGSQGV